MGGNPIAHALTRPPASTPHGTVRSRGRRVTCGWWRRSGGARELWRHVLGSHRCLTGDALWPRRAVG